MPRFFALLVSFITLCPLQSALSEVITIPIGQQGASLQYIPRPSRGMRSDQVIAQFGEPLSLASPTGDPPISRWHYPGFVVYFESDTVIHSVLIHTPKHPVPASDGDQ